MHLPFTAVKCPFDPTLSAAFNPIFLIGELLIAAVALCMYSPI